MSPENPRSLVASLAAFLLLATPVVASTASEADRTVGPNATATTATSRLAEQADLVAADLFGSPLTPAALAVSGNGVLEPGETVDVAPTWRNDGTTPVDVMGTASGFTGPPGATYTLEQDGADYGTLDPGQSGSCLDTGICYAKGLDDPAARPARHWDATFDETLDDPDGATKTWTLHIGDSFTDVPRTSLFYSWIETLLHSGVTGGCGAGAFCPNGAVTRAQMAVFLLKTAQGSDYAPPECQGLFADVPCPSLFADWVEDLATRGITGGCGGGNYCPAVAVNRAQFAVFTIRTFDLILYGP